METRVNYALVGLFVLLFSVALVALGLWLGSDISVTQYSPYDAYMEESVSGLNVNAPVKYHGVVVGRVRTIELDRNDPQRVHLGLDIRKGTPIKTDTVAKLQAQGLTGISYVELTGGSREAAPLTAKPGQAVPVIRTEPSLMVRLDALATHTVDALNKLSSQLSALLSADNRRAFSATLQNLQKISGALAENSDRLTRTIRRANQLMTAGAAAGKRIPNTLKKLDQSLSHFNATMDSITRTSEDVRKLTASGSADMAQLSRNTLPEIDALVGQLRVLTNDLQQFSRTLSQHPQMLIFGRPKSAPGPGE